MNQESNHEMCVLHQNLYYSVSLYIKSMCIRIRTGANLSIKMSNLHTRFSFKKAYT